MLKAIFRSGEDPHLPQFIFPDESAIPPLRGDSGKKINNSVINKKDERTLLAYLIKLASASQGRHAARVNRAGLPLAIR